MKIDHTIIEAAANAGHFGRTFLIRADVLAHELTGEGTLTEIAAKHGVSKQAMTRHHRATKKLLSRVHFKLTPPTS